ncbi:hypothetical protein [Mesorhizobium erdmanii]|uniref:Uncharacterized protein n=1 Tax=Mesorhizobium erdmanii TaxID=1777866 RepID=A0A6M7UMX6_9HYPH|nr:MULTISPECIES: hypothetical protein [Mesorhizobium]OBQ67986.1 hypothetical protein A8146_11260 [Mesorhizobium loti]QKC79399.1 hypothetical protein EB233_31520 [Mesorhizobium erdmanii]
MKEMTEIGVALDYIFDQIGSPETRYITAVAHTRIIGMKTSLKENYRFELLDIEELLQSLIYPDSSDHRAAGIVEYPQHLIRFYVLAAMMMIDGKEQSLSLLRCMKMFLILAHASHLLSLKREKGGWFLTGSAAFELQHQIRLRVRIPEPK